MALIGRPPKPLIERFANFIQLDENTGCWNWLGGVNKPQRGYGYAVISVLVEHGKSCKSYYAHLVAYELLIGEIPHGKDAHHICKNRICVNPHHLEFLTRSKHAAAHYAPKTHCDYGHLLDESNTFTRYLHGKRVGRGCIACRRIHGMKEYYKRVARSKLLATP